jgi:hypothetical protein
MQQREDIWRPCKAFLYSLPAPLKTQSSETAGISLPRIHADERSMEEDFTTRHSPVGWALPTLRAEGTLFKRQDHELAPNRVFLSNVVFVLASPQCGSFNLLN